MRSSHGSLSRLNDADFSHTFLPAENELTPQPTNRQMLEMDYHISYSREPSDMLNFTICVLLRFIGDLSVALTLDSLWHTPKPTP